MAGTAGERHITGNAAAQPVGMRLNQMADPGGGGGPSGLTSSPTEKQAAANAIERDIEPDTRTAGAWTDHETSAVVKAFGAKDGHGWLTSGAVQRAHKTWGEQVKDLMNLLSADKGSLRAANTTLQGTDVDVAAGVRRPSMLDQYSPPPQN
ncbi:hypothetical protein [Streptomyces sp. HUAS TT20]|uniref:hypothetical protein n=1 Tax=Streptomyces sp. HUAS TT20 TaxID=3447509 RepID=UPI0021DAA800|nr:hypothetical protein [Streptomyces sp. HUAS 15-9]UXY30298.1 hypothetical protein N8I87_29650 [Streptomyces sp. HUAS 15-9]